MFQFWIEVEGVRTQLNTNNLFEAERQARRLGTREYHGLNPNGKTFIVRF